MQPAYRYNGTTIYNGDTIAVMRQMEPKSVHCCVTSPPYYSIRDYGTATWEGGDPTCDHAAAPSGGPEPKRYTPGGSEMFRKQNDKQYRTVCAKCGAVRIDQQIGLEPSVGQYIEKMVAVFEEVRRVLRDDGTAWVNIADSYAGGGGYYPDAPSNQGGSIQAHGNKAGNRNIKGKRNTAGIPAKNLYLIPQRLAIALQDAGWFVRSVVIWSKPNPLPESVTDRPTTAHEYVLLLAKSERYFYNAEAVAEEVTDTEYRTRGKVRPSIDGLLATRQGGDNRSGLHKQIGGRQTRNLRTVWTITPEPVSFAHFACFPRALVRPCIRAATSLYGCCPTCGAGYRSVVEKSLEGTNRKPAPNKGRLGAPGERAANMTRDGFVPNREKKIETTGWTPSCSCPVRPQAELTPAVVFDPFLGSGTTALVAREEGRHCVGVELSLDYICIAQKRLAQASLFTREDSPK